MIKNGPLKTQLLIFILCSIVIGMSTLFYISYNNLKEEIDISKKDLYTQKIESMIYLIDEKYIKLQKTGMQNAYEEVFQKGTIDTIKEVFNSKNSEVNPFIINENRKFILNKNFKDDENFQKILELKNGDFDLINKKTDKWVIFKYYAPWDWIIGYIVPEDVKYKELCEFRDTFVISSILILLSISIFIILIIRKVLEAISKLSDVSKEITSGKLDANIEVTGAKELVDLATNFSLMRDKVLKDINQLKEQDEKIIGFNKKLKEVVKNRTKELEEEKEVFETLFNDSSDGLTLLKDEKFIACNSALIEMLNCNSKEEFLNLTPSDLSPPKQPDGEDSRKKSQRIIKECLEKGNSRFEWVSRKITGEDFWAEIVLTKVVINHEQLIHVVWRNIDYKKQLELDIQNKNCDLQESNDELETMLENLKTAQNKLVQSEKLAGLGSLVAGVAHEVNTPVGVSLTGVSHLEFLCEDINEKYNNNQMTEEEFQTYLKSSGDLVKVISSNLERTADIIKSFKQVAVDQTSEQKRVFKIKEYIRGILVSIDSLTKKYDIEFKIDCDESLAVTSYPGFFAQIITNLVSNSVNHAYEKDDSGIVSITITSEENEITLTYKDDGKGIPKENMSKIYEPFFTTYRDRGGSGLGLNIIYNLVTTNLHGTIECKSELNKGTTFIIKIPV